LSTERLTDRSGDRSLNRSPSPDFETRDFYLSCFLRCLGYELIDLRSEGRRRVFVFRDRPARRDDVMAFYGDGVTVPPLAFSNIIKDMKALLHNA
jgi:hypothetical protein